MTRWTFTSESVTEGHPDKVADQISDAILDALLTEDETARAAVETLVTTGIVVIAGELKTTAYVDIAKVARETITRIGYDRGTLGFDGNTCGVMVALDEQSSEITKSVFKAGTGEEQGAGDQGLMFGYACTETDALMPMPIHVAHRLAQQLTEARRSGCIPYLRPDGKTQVSFEYEDGEPVRLATVLISAHHDDTAELESMMGPDLREQVLAPALPPQFADDDFEFLVNPSGGFELGGPVADTGLTGRKIIVDTYGGYTRHGGGALSGKDPSKVDRSGAYAARWVAKNLVAAGAATRCELQVAYAIGRADPVSVMVDTFGTATVDPDILEPMVRSVFDLRPAKLIEELGLRKPIYERTAAYGHFGREPEGDSFPWERTDRVGDVKSALGL
ncbi:MAG TPA: methionine adenosyltransferase [Acidimicrobiaceae bacterium]|nr:methionine adenosyltransferase [Acidimicrobiaceae bacterium]HCB37302.1 methionine adenosyltransferase [Acidimicrobiaceae bacterium]